MQTVLSTSWRTLSDLARITYRINAAGQIAVRGAPGAPPPSPGSWAEFKPGTTADEWVVRTTGAPVTMAAIQTFFYGMALDASDRNGVDVRIILTTIAVESGSDRGHPSGRDMRSPRTEPGYPERAGDGDPGDPRRDAIDWTRTGGTKSSHGIMQTLIGTAVRAVPAFFAGKRPDEYRAVLWDPRISIEAGTRHIRGFPAEDRNDPIRCWVHYNAGSVRRSASRAWGAYVWSDEALWKYAAFWNDLAAVMNGEFLTPRQVGLGVAGVALVLLSTAITVAHHLYKRSA